jgi:hypothetical protein
MAERDKSVRRHETAKRSQWLGPLATVVTEEGKRRACTPERFVLDSLRARVVDGIEIDAEGFFDMLAMFDNEDFNSPEVRRGAAGGGGGW